MRTSVTSAEEPSVDVKLCLVFPREALSVPVMRHMLGGVPAAVADAAIQLQELDRVNPAAPSHAVLAVGGEGHIARAERPPGADLRRLLAEQ